MTCIQIFSKYHENAIITYVYSWLRCPLSSEFVSECSSLLWRFVFLSRSDPISKVKEQMLKKRLAIDVTIISVEGIQFPAAWKQLGKYSVASMDTSRRPLKVRTEGSQSRVREHGSIEFFNTVASLLNAATGIWTVRQLLKDYSCAFWSICRIGYYCIWVMLFAPYTPSCPAFAWPECSRRYAPCMNQDALCFLSELGRRLPSI